MGATTFETVSSGPTPEAAFKTAVTNAKYMYGHAGYTGTIAEKSSFTMATSKLLSEPEACKLANSLINTDYSNKWGPAGCIKLDKPGDFFLFFGWASE